MFQRTLVVFENERVCAEASSYSRELALRMDAEVTFLMLVEMAFVERSFLGRKRDALIRLEERTGKSLGALSSEFLKHGIPVSAALRVGDPAQEFLKFLAERAPFQAGKRRASAGTFSAQARTLAYQGGERPGMPLAVGEQQGKDGTSREPMGIQGLKTVWKR